MKRLTDEARQIEKEFRTKTDKLTDVRRCSCCQAEFYYKEKSREAESSAVIDVLQTFDCDLTEERKLKQGFKTQQIIEESLDLEIEYSLAIQQYNEYVDIYRTKMVLPL